ncbi:MAG: DUF4870 domain-containing protein [Candidatus Gastranaerophilales bacterium]|nr:DUF4870 domain-containing protein [Candidatus Gastranaerophilales bacterium]
MSDTNFEDEKGFLMLSSLGAILGIVIPLIMWALKKDNFSDYAKNFLTDMLNFEIVVLIAYIVGGIIPFIGWLFCIVLFFVNLVTALRCFSATQNRAEYSFPIKVKLL